MINNTSNIQAKIYNVNLNKKSFWHLKGKHLKTIAKLTTISLMSLNYVEFIGTSSCPTRQDMVKSCYPTKADMDKAIFGHLSIC